MKFDGEVRLRARREEVWAALHDETLLKECVPGCEKLEWLDDRTLEADMTLRAAGLRHHYSSRVHIRDTVPMQSYTLLFGGTAETASVKSRVRLVPEGESTRILYEVEARLDNKLAKLGSALVERIARKMATSFFHRLEGALNEADADT